MLRFKHSKFLKLLMIYILHFKIEDLILPLLLTQKFIQCCEHKYKNLLFILLNEEYNTDGQSVGSSQTGCVL